MANHPNRSRSNPARNPTPAEIKSARVAAELTQQQAAEKILHSVRAWEKWESGERRMHPALFDYFLIKTRQKAIARMTLDT